MRLSFAITHFDMFCDGSLGLIELIYGTWGVACQRLADAIRSSSTYQDRPTTDFTSREVVDCLLKVRQLVLAGVQLDLALSGQNHELLQPIVSPARYSRFGGSYAQVVVAADCERYQYQTCKFLLTTELTQIADDVGFLRTVSRRLRTRMTALTVEIRSMVGILTFSPYPTT